MAYPAQAAPEYALPPPAPGYASAYVPSLLVTWLDQNNTAGGLGGTVVPACEGAPLPVQIVGGSAGGTFSDPSVAPDGASAAQPTSATQLGYWNGTGFVPAQTGAGFPTHDDTLATAQAGTGLKVAGTLAVSNAGTAPLSVGGTLAISSGTLAVTNSGTTPLSVGGTLALSTGGTLAVTNAGTSALAVGGTVALSSGATVALSTGNTIAVANAGTSALSVGGTVALSAGGTVALAGGSSLIGLVNLTTTAGTFGATTARGICTAGAALSGVVKNSNGQVYGYAFSNAGSSTIFARLYAAASVTVGAGTPSWGPVAVPPGGTVTQVFDTGLVFASGICVAMTGGAADSDTTTLAAAGMRLLGGLQMNDWLTADRLTAAAPPPARSPAAIPAGPAWEGWPPPEPRQWPPPA